MTESKKLKHLKVKKVSASRGKTIEVPGGKWIKYNFALEGDVTDDDYEGAKREADNIVLEWDEEETAAVMELMKKKKS